MPRTRTRGKIHTEGSYTTYSLFSPRVNGGGLYAKSSQLCEDTVSTRPYGTPHNLELTLKEVTVPLYVRGKWKKSPSIEYHVNSFYSPGGFFSDANAIPSTNAENWDYWFTKAIANMNPNKPQVDLPLFIYEMKDFPRMLHNLGRWLQYKSTRRNRSSSVVFQEFKRVMTQESPNNLIPDSFLSYNFGWAPLIADLFRLFDFHKAWEFKLKQLSEMKGGPRIKRTLHKFEGTGDDQYFIWLFAAASTYPRYKINRSEKIWFTAYATLLDEVPDRNSNADFNRLMLGLKADSISTMWNLIPWSWAFDYFSNIGDVLSASDGQLKWEYDKVCVMSHQETIYTCLSYNTPPGVYVDKLPKALSSSKRRRVRTHPTPAFTFSPWITTKQSANLGAIGLLYLLKNK